MLKKFCVLFCGSFLLSFAARSGEPAKKKWEVMEYGPILGGTFRMEVGKPIGEDYSKGNEGVVLKGLIVRVNKDKQAYICYDEEEMRVRGAWAGGFIDWNGVIFKGDHHALPRVVGTLDYAAKNAPGWANKDGTFEDPRKDQNGPLPADWLKYKGCYLNGENVIFSYRVGDCDVLEMPGIVVDGANMIFTRTIHLGKSSQTLLLDTPDKNVGVNTAVSGIKTEAATVNGRNVTPIPAHADAITIKIAFSKNAGDALKDAASKADDLPALCKGGALRWNEQIKTQGVVAENKEPYVVDTLTLPDANPWNSWLRLGGVDFFADGKRAAVSTWSGDVWIVSGIDDTLQNLSWKRYATGLYQPLGLKIVDEKIYCTCRDQIVRLHDLNNDGEADFYECFNNDMLLTRHFHEFTLDLQTDSAGNFYFAKGCTPGRGGPNFDLWSEHNGAYFKLSKDGGKLEVLARGLRAPNGIGVGPNGELTSCDNQGSWVPECPINWIKPGAFVGIPDGVPGDVKPTKRDPPLCWLPMDVDNSGGGQVWVTSDKFGPFKNQMLHLSYGKCSLFKVMYEKAGDWMQGGVVRFPLNFGSGVMRSRFNSVDGNLYVCGLKGWQTSGTRDGILQRVRYTGKPVHMPTELHVTKTGLEITFTNSLDKAETENVENWSGQQFNVIWSKGYGSPEFSVADPSKKMRDPIAIKSVKLQPDGKTVVLEIPEIKPVNNMVIKSKIKAADGTPINVQINNTIHQVP